MRRSNESLVEAMVEMEDDDIRAGLTTGQWKSKRANATARAVLDGTIDRKKVKAEKAKREREELAQVKADRKESQERHSKAKAGTKVVEDGEGSPRPEEARTVVVKPQEEAKAAERVQEGSPSFRADEGKSSKNTNHSNVNKKDK